MYSTFLALACLNNMYSLICCQLCTDSATCISSEMSFFFFIVESIQQSKLWVWIPLAYGTFFFHIKQNVLWSSVSEALPFGHHFTEVGIGSVRPEAISWIALRIPKLHWKLAISFTKPWLIRENFCVASIFEDLFDSPRLANHIVKLPFTQELDK